MKTLIRLCLIWVMVGFVSSCDKEAAQSGYQPSAATQQYKHHYIIGIHPYLNSQKLYSAYAPILAYLETQVQDADFTLETSPDYASYEQKLHAGHFHFALPNPYQTLDSLAVGYRVMARMAPDSVFKGLIIARKDSHIHQVQQLKNQSIAFTAKTALAATMMPKYYLYMNGVNVDTEMQPRYVTSQFSAIMNVYNKDTFAAATWPIAYKAWQQEFSQQADALEVLWETPFLVNNAWVVRYDIPDALANRVADLLINLSNHALGKTLLQPTACDGFLPATDKDYAPVAEFIKAYQASGLE